jgi:hypothetical protein
VVDYKLGRTLRSGYQELHTKESKIASYKNNYKYVRMLQEHPKNRLGNLGYAETYVQGNVKLNFAKSTWLDIGIQHASGPVVEISEAMCYAKAEAVWGIMNKQHPSIENLNDKLGYVRKMRDLHDQFELDQTELLSKCKPYLAQMQDTVDELICRWQQLLGDALSVYKSLVGQPFPTPINADDKLHYDEYGVLFHHIQDKYGPISRLTSIFLGSRCHPSH